jgi:cell division protein FtsB
MNNYEGVQKRRHGKKSIPALFLYPAIVVILCIASSLIYSFSGTARDMAHEKANVSQIEASIQDMKLKNQELEKETLSLKTNAGMEVQARHLGYVKKGEVTLVIPP